MIIYTVQSGDTVFSISQKFNILPEKLIADNAIPKDNALAVGQSLIILDAQSTYDVPFTQSISSISQMTNVPQKTIYRNNFFLFGNTSAPQYSQIVLQYKQTPVKNKIIGGYAYDFIDETLLESVINYMTYIMPFTYGFRTDGSLIEPNDNRILMTARSYNVKPLMHLSTLTDFGNFSSELANTMLNDTQSSETLIQNCLKNVQSKGYYGIDVDFEYLPFTSRQPYVDFISRLTQTMNNNGYICVVAVPPKTADMQEGLLYEGVDYTGLGLAANYVFLMTYEWGYRFGPPLPIAPIPSVRRVLDYAVTRIDSQKLLLGISNYGYDWTLPFVQGKSDAPSLSTEYALELAVRYGAEIFYDTNAQAPYFNYTDEFGDIHIVWFEDARSIKAKAELIEQYNLSGGFIWDLMRKNPQLYVTINSLIDIEI